MYRKDKTPVLNVLVVAQLHPPFLQVDLVDFADQESKHSDTRRKGTLIVGSEPVFVTRVECSKRRDLIRLTLAAMNPVTVMILWSWSGGKTIVSLNTLFVMIK